MKNNFRFVKPRAGDIIIVLLLLTAAGALTLFGGRGEALYAVITVDGHETKTISLADVETAYEVTTENGVVVYIESDGVTVKSSPCTSKDCVRCGKLTKTGATAVCAPQKTVVQITGRSTKNNPDAISY